MNNSNLKVDIREVIKDFNHKLITSNPSSIYLEREYRLNGWNEGKSKNNGSLDMKFEVREETNDIVSFIESYDDKFKIRMIRMSLN